MQKQKGVALMIVLLVVALVTILATQMVTRLQLNVSRTSNIKSNNQAYWYAMGAEQFAKKSLRDLAQLNSENTIHLSQPWAQKFEYPVDGGSIEAQLIDMQSCFNLNALSNAQTNSSKQTNNQASQINIGAKETTDEDGEVVGPIDNNANQDGSNVTPESPKQVFRDLLTNLDVDIDAFTADTVTDSLVDWLDDDSQQSQFGAEDGEYESLPAPYLAANALMSNKSEIRLVNGVEPQWLDHLLPYICVIPALTELKININTLNENAAPLLAALVGITTDSAQQIINSRPPNGYKDIADFFAEPNIAAQNLPASKQAWFDTKTEYFMLHVKTRYNDAQFKMSTVFKYTNQDISVKRREFGGVN